MEDLAIFCIYMLYLCGFFLCCCALEWICEHTKIGNQLMNWMLLRMGVDPNEEEDEDDEW